MATRKNARANIANVKGGGIACPMCGQAIEMTGGVSSLDEKCALLGWTWATPPAFNGDMNAYGNLPSPEPFDKRLPCFAGTYMDNAGDRHRCEWTGSDGLKAAHIYVKVGRSGRKSHRIVRWRE